MITTDWTLLFFTYGVGLIASDLAEVLHDIPKLSCAVVSCTYQGGSEEEYAIADGPHTAVKRRTEAGLTEQTVITLNPSCARPPSTSAVDKLRDAFVRH